MVGGEGPFCSEVQKHALLKAVCVQPGKRYIFSRLCLIYLGSHIMDRPLFFKINGKLGGFQVTGEVSLLQTLF